MRQKRVDRKESDTEEPGIAEAEEDDARLVETKSLFCRRSLKPQFYLKPILDEETTSTGGIENAEALPTY